MTLFTAIKKWLHRMFGKTEKKTVQPVKTKKKLSRADKKQIEAAIARANRTDKKGKSAQDSIPYVVLCQEKVQIKCNQFSLF